MFDEFRTCSADTFSRKIMYLDIEQPLLFCNALLKHLRHAHQLRVSRDVVLQNLLFLLSGADKVCSLQPQVGYPISSLITQC